MEPELDLLAALFPKLSAQLRMTLQNLQVSAARLAPADRREQDPALDLEAARLDQSYYRLLRLTNSLTAAVWLDSKRPLRLQNRDLIELLHQVYDSVESLARLKGLTIRLDCPQGRHLCAVDPEGLRQILYQLLSNALKFTPAGGVITLGLKLEQGKVRFSVTDNGPGVPPEQLNHLFDRDLTLESFTALPEQGLGLGLLLSQAIAQAHQGSLIMIPQTPGCRFVLSLPDLLTGDSGLSDVVFDYAGGFNDALMRLADAMPVEAFLLRNQ